VQLPGDLYPWIRVNLVYALALAGHQYPYQYRLSGEPLITIAVLNNEPKRFVTCAAISETKLRALPYYATLP